MIIIEIVLTVIILVIVWLHGYFKGVKAEIESWDNPFPEEF